MKSLKELVDVLQDLDQETELIIVAKRGPENIICVHGSPAGIMVALCIAQEKDERIKGIIQGSVEAFGMAEELGIVDARKRRAANVN